MLLSVIALSALLAVRAHRRAASGDIDFAAARLHAQAAIDLALLTVERRSRWRTELPAGWWVADLPLDDGSCAVHAIDPLDGDLTNSPTDPVVLTGVGRVREARYILEGRFEPMIVPLDALRACLHAGGNVTVGSGTSLTVSGGPLSSNGDVYVNGAIDGDVEAQSVDRPPRVSGSITAPAPIKDMPDASVLADLEARATTIPYSSTISGVVISRASNPWGKPNADGVYFLDTGGQDLVIQGTRLVGTLVVRCTGKTVELDRDVIFQPDQAERPVLVVDGNVRLRYASVLNTVDELLWGVNFNPPGTPYGGVSDIDTLDSYPCEVRGLVYVTGSVEFGESARVRGVVICGGDAAINGSNTIQYLSAPYESPPEGFTQPGRLALIPGTLRRVLVVPD